MKSSGHASVDTCAHTRAHDGGDASAHSTTSTGDVLGALAEVDLVEALNAFHTMRELGVLTNATTYDTLITACVEGHQLEQAIEVYHVMLQHEIDPGEATCNAVVRAFAHEDLLEQALALFQTMLQQDVVPDAKARDTLLRGLLRTFMYEQALQVYRELRLRGLTPEPDLAAWCEALGGSAHARRTVRQCKFHARGSCKYGKLCNFAHSSREPAS